MRSTCPGCGVPKAPRIRCINCNLPAPVPNSSKKKKNKSPKLQGKCRKVRYHQKVDAELALLKTKKRAERQDRKALDRKETRAYECPKCKGWHLTSQERRN